VASGSELPLTCWICGMAVSLESCAIDEHGMAVHEDCSVRKIGIEGRRIESAAQATAQAAT